MKCNSCKWYDSSVDACNCDDKCYMDGKDEVLETLASMMESEHIESIDCEDCAYNAGIATCISLVEKFIKGEVD